MTTLEHLPEASAPNQPNLQKDSTRKSHGSDDEPRKPAQSTLLVQMAQRFTDRLFHDLKGRGYAVLRVPDTGLLGAHMEVWPIQSVRFRGWLQKEFFQRFRSAASKAAIDSAVAVIDAKACFGSTVEEVYVRVARLRNEIWLDLCDDRWRAVRITAKGWEIADMPSVNFVRSGSSLALPEPVKGGTVNELRRYVNVQSQRDWILFVSCIVMALRGAGPYPILELKGGEGTAKTTNTEIVGKLTDPRNPPHRSAPKDMRDLAIAVQGSHLYALDNLSSIPTWLSDALCRISTGSGYATRKNYSDEEEQTFAAERPTVINGITELVTKADFADRVVSVSLAIIPDEERQSKGEFWKAFAGSYPRILGAVLDVVSAALANEGKVKLATMPRMADFAIWATAAEQALGFASGDFMRAHREARFKADEAVIESHPAIQAVIHLMQKQDEWTGTHSDLWRQITGGPVAGALKGPDWPRTPKGLSIELDRCERLLKNHGIVREEVPRQSGARLFRLRRLQGVPAVPCSNGTKVESAT